MVTRYIECRYVARHQGERVVYVNPSRIVYAFKQEEKFFITFLNGDDKATTGEITESAFMNLIGKDGKFMVA